MKNGKAIVIGIVFALAMLAFVGCASAATIYVNPGESIQDAVNVASSGDTIIVRDSTYTENVKVNKRLTIQSENGSDSTIVQAANPNDHVFEVTADYANISGFTAREATEDQYAGIYLRGVKYCNVTNNTVSNNYYGIYENCGSPRHSSNNALTGNTANSNRYGIALCFCSNNTLIGNIALNNTFLGILFHYSSNNTLANNTVSDNRDNLSINGRELSHFTHNIDTSNTVNGKHVQYLVDKKDIVIDSSWDVGYLGIVNCTNITVHDLRLANNGEGMLVAYSSDVRVQDANTSNNLYGICLRSSSNNTITCNTANSNYFYGIALISSNNNKIYLNNFAYNLHNVYPSDSTNFWSSPEEIAYTYNGETYTNYLGNYWSDYTGSDADGDGIGDAPYSIGGDKDNYPLMERFENYIELSERPWPMFQHDAQHTGRSPFVGPGILENPEVQVFIEGDYFYPVVIDSSGILYSEARINGKEGVYAFYPNGIQKWRYDIPLGYYSSSSLMVFTPIIGPDGTIYISAPYNKAIIAINPDGSLKWEGLFPDLAPQYLVMDNNRTIYSLVCNASANCLIALDADSGNTLWMYEVEHLGGGWSEPAVGYDGTIYFGYNDTLYAINSDGTEKWERRFIPDCQHFNCQPKVSTPSIGDDGTIYVVVRQEKDFWAMQDAGILPCLHAINPEDPNEEKWPAKCNKFYGSGPLTISSTGNLYFTGAYEWITTLFGFDSQGNDLENWPVTGIGRGGLLIVDKEEIIYGLFGSPYSTLKAFDQSGEEKWALPLSILQWDGHISLGGDGTIYVTGNQKLYAISPGPSDITPPLVSSVSPENSAPDVSVGTNVTATFGEAMDSSTITTDSFTLEGSAVLGTVEYDSGTYTATFRPDANLDYDHEYTATLSTAITDEAGNPLTEPYTWGFTTESGRRFEIGDITKVTNTGDSGLWIHENDPTGETTKVVPNEWTFRIIGGPQYDIQEHNWWEVRVEKYEPSPVEGWVAEDFIKEVSSEDLVPSSPPSYFIAAQDKVEQAIEWAESKERSPEWEDWCLKFVREAFQGEPIQGWTSVEAARQQLEGEDKFYLGISCWDPPRGALVFFSTTGEYEPYGHIGIYLGDGEVVHAYDTVRIQNLAGSEGVEQLGYIGSYIGWAYPPGEWLKNQPPVADAEPDYAYVRSGEVVHFDGSNSNDPDGAIVSYEWDFGDGGIATGVCCSHRFRGTMNESKNYVVTLTVEDDMGAIDTDSICVTAAPIEKTIEISHHPGEPYGGGIVTEEMLARMTASYNWVGVNEDGEDVYVVSKIHFQGHGYFGYVLSVWDAYSLSVPTPAWSQAAWGETEKTFAYPFGSYRDWTVTFGEEHFEGLAVGPFDVMQVHAWTIQKGVPPAIPILPFVEVAHGCFQPSSGQISGSIGELLWASLHSPGEIRVYDSEGRVTGLVDGETKEEISYSAYNDDIIVILHSADSCTYEVEGTDEGSYGLGVASVEDGEATTFTATDVPTTSGAIHQYTIDWDALSQGEEGVTVQVDSDGDGVFEQTITADGELSHDEFVLQTATTIDFDLDTLNLQSKGKWVTVYTELPAGYNVTEINLSTMMLNETVPAELYPTEIGDYDSDGIPDLMVKFGRQAVIAMLPVGDAVNVTVTGKLYDGTPFEGSDTIRVIDEGKGE